MRVTDHTNYQDYQNIYGQDDWAGHRADSQASSSDSQAAKEEENLSGTRAVGTDSGNAPDLPANTNSKPSEKADSLLERMRQQTNSAQKSFSASGNNTLYSSTADLMAIANTESQEILRGIYVRLSFKLWSVRAKGATGTDSKAIKSATRSIQKVMGKVKGKIKGLQKEEEMEK